jgi:hypothetical protein
MIVGQESGLAAHQVGGGQEAAPNSIQKTPPDNVQK